MKNKVCLYLLFFMAFSFNTIAQNLVPNYSFESYIKCVNGYDEFNGYVADWTGQGVDGLCWCTAQCADSTPKYSSVSVPYNFCGFQSAHTGVSYAELWPYVNGGSAFYNYRNYIEAKLIDSLKPGGKYYLTFFISLADSSDYACNDIGAYFSDSALSFKGDSVKYYLTPQVANNPIKNPLTDTMNWMKITGSFIAKGGEKYVIIGNFKTDSASNITYLGNRSPDATGSYDYIDDVIVSPDSNYADSIFASVPVINKPSEVVKVSPNPSKGFFNFRMSNQEQGIKNTIEVYNALGEKIYQQLAMNSEQFTINLADQPNGIYLYRIVSENGSLVASGKLIVE